MRTAVARGAGLRNPPRGPLNTDITRIFVAIGIFATIALRNWAVVMYAAQYAMVVAVVVHLIAKRMKFRAGMYAGFFGLFAVWCLTSAFWARDRSSALEGTAGVLHFVILGTAIAAYVIAERCPEFLLSCIAWSVLGLMFVLVIVTPLDTWQQALAPTLDASSDANRIGYTVRYHPNALGRITAIGAFIWFYRLRADKSYVVPKLLAIALLVAVLVGTKSRLAILLFVVLVFFFILLTARHLGRFLASTVFAAAFVGVTAWALFAIPALYNTVGFRFSAMLGLSGEVDASTSTRAQMTSIALELWRDNPLTGVGFGNFSYYYFYTYAGWAETYAHNTYAELLADLGIVGVITYFGLLVWIVIALFRMLGPARRRGDSLLVAFLFLLAASQLVADVASISYTNDFVQLVTVLVFTWTVILRQDESRSPGDFASECSSRAGRREPSGRGRASQRRRRQPADPNTRPVDAAPPTPSAR